MAEEKGLKVVHDTQRWNLRHEDAQCSSHPDRPVFVVLRTSRFLVWSFCVSPVQNPIMTSKYQPDASYNGMDFNSNYQLVIRVVDRKLNGKARWNVIHDQDLQGSVPSRINIRMQALIPKFPISH